MIIKIGGEIEKALNRHGIKQEAQAAQICSVFDAIIKREYGKRISQNAKAVSVKNNVLIVQVTSPIWSAELLQRSESILQLLKKDLQKNHFFSKQKQAEQTYRIRFITK